MGFNDLGLDYLETKTTTKNKITQKGAIKNTNNSFLFIYVPQIIINNSRARYVTKKNFWHFFYAQVSFCSVDLSFSLSLKSFQLERSNHHWYDHKE